VVVQKYNHDNLGYLFMKLLTFQLDGQTRIGVLVGAGLVLDLSTIPDLTGVNTMVELIQAGPAVLNLIAQELRHAQTDSGSEGLLPLEAVTLLAPIPRPGKNVFCVGRNYREHIVEAARMRGSPIVFPKVPEFFSKPPTTVIGPDAGVKRHAAHTEQLDYEVELAVIIGRQIRDVTQDAAMDAVFGYAVINDITARDAQFAHGQWFKGKSFDSFCAFGPWIVTADEFGDPSTKTLTLKVNGKHRQGSGTADMLFSIPEIIAALSAGMTLEPGDIIATGTPSGVAMGMVPPEWLRVGDVMEAEIAGIGILRNTVVD
jgi:2-keto-4-pentenoate hydratase/2-oxohepta-3-ene-1,7-dioic acid hydratase in catechol pathway